MLITAKTSATLQAGKQYRMAMHALIRSQETTTLEAGKIYEIEPSEYVTGDGERLYTIRRVHGRKADIKNFRDMTDATIEEGKSHADKVEREQDAGGGQAVSVGTGNAFHADKDDPVASGQELQNGGRASAEPRRRESYFGEDNGSRQ